VVCKGKLAELADNRVHLVIYFFASTRCKQSDIELLQKLSPLTNILPVISMADQYSEKELSTFKTEILQLPISNKNIRFLNCAQALKQIIRGRKEITKISEKLL